MSILRSIPVFFALFFLAACAATPIVSLPEFQRGPGTTGPISILLAPPDLEVSVLNAGGVSEPNAEWTTQARVAVDSAISAEERERGLRFTRFDREALDETQAQLIDLHEVVGRAIMFHQMQPRELPNRVGQVFTWSLGPEVKRFAPKGEANYVLFLFFRDQFSSAGRVALKVLAALVNVPVQGGVQTAFASLVDLRTGDVVWFAPMGREVGDLRTPEGAREAVKILFASMPK